jgi:hypothetical protein
MDAMSKSEGETADDELLETARERMEAAKQADQANREEALDDLRILTGLDQWPEDIRADREQRGRACLVVNQLPQFLRQVTGDLRSTNPSIKVNAADSAADPKVAEVYEGIIRHIQNRSDATSVYERAAESAAACGMGYWRVLADYEHEGSFDQDIRVELIANPFSVYLDPDAVAPTREDAEWGFITSSMDEDDYKEKYPEAPLTPVGADGVTDNLASWRDGKKVIIAEYFWKERKPAKLYLLKDGTTVIDPEKPPAKRQIVKERDGTKTVVKWAKISGDAVLEGPQDVPGKYIPVVAVMGEELYAGDRVYRSSVIRHAKDPQRIFNMTWSAAVEGIAVQSRAPWLGSAANFAGLEEMWRNPDAVTTTLIANPDPQTGQMPSRQTPPIASQGLSDLLNRSTMDLRSTTGIQDAALGQRSSEHSGVAIRQRQQESDNSTSIYADNMGKGIAYCGRIIVNWIPLIYDTARAVRIIGKDGAVAMQPVNQVDMSGQAPVMIDLAQGQYDVEVEVGPNHATRMQAAAEGMMQFAQIAPQSLPIIGDLLVKNMGWPGADQIADRLKKAMPPGVGDQQQPDPAQMQAMQMQQMQMQAQQQAQQQAMVHQEEMMKLEYRKSLAEVTKAEAQAAEAQAKAMQARVEAGAAGMMPAPMQA